MNLIQLLNGKDRGNKGILSHIAKFLTIECPNLEQNNKKDKELTDSEKNENKDIFKFIYGHDKLKIIFRNAIESEEPIHILLTGSSGTAKSLFLEAISDNVKNSYFINNNSTGAGIISYLYSHPELEFLLIDEIEKLKKEEIQAICNNITPGKNNVIIPFSDLIRHSIPKEKALDMTRANRLSTYLSFLPVVYFNKRPRITIVKKGDTKIQILPIATFEDLLNTVSLMEYSDGVRPYILEWYYDVFLKAFEEKEEPDSKLNSKGEELKEDRIALTSQDITKKHKEVQNKTLTSKQLLESYLYPLINQGYIDKMNSVIDGRANIYFPIITTKKYINLFENEKSNNLLQQKTKIVVNSTIFPSKQHIISKIEPILKYYSESDFIIKIKNHLDEEISLEELVDQYFANADDYFEIEGNDKETSNSDNSDDNTTTNSNISDTKNSNTVITPDNNSQEFRHNEGKNDDNNSLIHNLESNEIQEIEKDNFFKRRPAEEYFQMSQNLELSQQNVKDDIKITINSEKQDKKLFENKKTNKIIYFNSSNDSFSLDHLDKEQRKKIEGYLNSGKILKCHHKNCLQAQFSTLYDYNMHCHNKHPKQPLYPEVSLIKILGLEAKANPWE